MTQERRDKLFRMVEHMKAAEWPGTPVSELAEEIANILIEDFDVERNRKAVVRMELPSPYEPNNIRYLK